MRALSAVVQYNEKSGDWKGYISKFFVNPSKVFGTVNTEILVGKRKAYGTSSTALSLLIII